MRFFEALNNDDWGTVREVVADNFVFHHPMGGTVEAGPRVEVGRVAEIYAGGGPSHVPEVELLEGRL